MRREVLLSSLGVGRCFTAAVEPGGVTDETASSSRRADPILAPGDAWKVTGDADGQVEAVSASGQEKAFPGEARVVEIPRQGYDKLAARG